MIDGIYFSEYILQLEEKLVTSSKSLLFFVILSKKETGLKEKAKLTFLDFFDSLISKYLIFKSYFCIGSGITFWYTFSTYLFHKNLPIDQVSKADLLSFSRYQLMFLNCCFANSWRRKI